MFLAYHDRVLSEHLPGSNVKRVFRYVDDYLIVLDCKSVKFDESVSRVLEIFNDCLTPLELIHEVPQGVHT